MPERYDVRDDEPLADPLRALSGLGTLAANTVARAVARAIYEAEALPYPGSLPSWRDKFAHRQ